MEREYLEAIERPRWASYPPRAEISRSGSSAGNHGDVETIEEDTPAAVLKGAPRLPPVHVHVPSAFPSAGPVVLRSAEDRNVYTNSYPKYYSVPQSVLRMDGEGLGDDEEPGLQSQAPRKGRWLIFGASETPSYAVPKEAAVPSPEPLVVPASTERRQHVSRLSLNPVVLASDNPLSQRSARGTGRTVPSGHKLSARNCLTSRPSHPVEQLSKFERKAMRYAVPESVIPGILHEQKKKEAVKLVKNHKGAFYQNLSLKKV